MRKLFLALLLVVGLLVGLTAAGCGYDEEAEGGLTPQMILSKAIEAAEGVKSAAATFDVTLDMEADDAASAQANPMLTGPVKLNGTMAASDDPLAADLGVTASVGDGAMTFSMGMKIAEAKAWMQFMGEWYEMPPEVSDALKQSASQEQPKFDAQMLSKLGIDPMTWLKELKLVGTEKLEGVEAYHLAATPDIAKMMADVVTIMNSEEMKKLMASAGGEGSLEQMSGMDPAHLTEMQAQLQSMIKDPKAELWVEKGSFYPRKMTVSAMMAPPEGVPSDGVQSMDLSMTINLNSINKPVTVKAPESAKPFTDLMNAFGEAGAGMSPLMPGATTAQ